jgi:hypothetical protein
VAVAPQELEQPLAAPDILGRLQEISMRVAVVKVDTLVAVLVPVVQVVAVLEILVVAGLRLLVHQV